MLRKAAIVVVGIIILIWVFSNPALAGTDVHNWWTGALAFFGHAAKG